MSSQRDKVLIVDDDPEVRSLLRENVLNGNRYEVFEAADGADGLAQASAHKPDLVLLDLVMPGLSGADFLVGLRSKGFTNPIIVITKRGSEAMAIDCFRLGAMDYITKPLREAEILRAVEHALEEVRLRRERQELLERLQTSNQQLEGRLHALTTLSKIGKDVSSMLNLEQLFDRVLDAAISITSSDHAMLMLYDEESQKLILRAGKNMSLVMQERLGEALNDPIAGLVMTSGEPFTGAGEALQQFHVSSEVHAVIYAPMIIQGKVVGALTVGNHRKRRTFDDSLAFLLEILAGYAAIAIVNGRLFTALEKRARRMERSYEDLKLRDAKQQRVIAGIDGLQQSVFTLQAEIKRTKSGAVSQKLIDGLNDFSQQIAELMNAGR
jgi:two-component system, NtrC family, sensor kinase